MHMGPLLEVELTIRRLRENIVHTIRQMQLRETEEMDAIVESSVKEANIADMVRSLSEIAIREEVQKAVRQAIASLFDDHSVRDAVRDAACRALGGSDAKPS